MGGIFPNHYIRPFENIDGGAGTVSPRPDFQHFHHQLIAFLQYGGGRTLNC